MHAGAADTPVQPSVDGPSDAATLDVARLPRLRAGTAFSASSTAAPTSGPSTSFQLRPPAAPAGTCGRACLHSGRIFRRARSRATPPTRDQLRPRSVRRRAEAAPVRLAAAQEVEARGANFHRHMDGAPRMCARHFPLRRRGGPRGGRNSAGRRDEERAVTAPVTCTAAAWRGVRCGHGPALRLDCLALACCASPARGPGEGSRHRASSVARTVAWSALPERAPFSTAVCAQNTCPTGAVGALAVGIGICRRGEPGRSTPATLRVVPLLALSAGVAALEASKVHDLAVARVDVLALTP
jgi:hypothetical protein